MPLPIPPGLDAQRRLGPAWAAWLDRLPRLAAEVVEEWQLVLDGAPMHGYASLAQPVRTAGGRPAVLKVAFDGDEESLHEGIALQRWHGDGAVSLLRADPHRRALLLERLHTEDLGDLWDVEACEVVAGLYARLHVPALPQLRTVTSYVEGWAAALARMPRNAPVPRRLVEQALSLARDLVADDASTGTLVHGDLHYANVLAADREPWLAIDPKPMDGDPHYEPAPLLWNRWDELTGARAVGARRGAPPLPHRRRRRRARRGPGPRLGGRPDGPQRALVGRRTPSAPAATSTPTSASGSPAASRSPRRSRTSRR